LNLDEETIRILKLMGEKYEKYYIENSAEVTYNYIVDDSRLGSPCRKIACVFESSQLM
jgi:hypothetical protein